jgi:hypothetical protein
MATFEYQKVFSHLFGDGKNLYIFEWDLDSHDVWNPPDNGGMTTRSIVRI